MTPYALLAELRRRGVELVAAGDRLRFRPATAMPLELIEVLRGHKAALLALVAYRDALRRRLTAQGQEADPAEVRQVHQEILRRIDEVGEPTATQLRQQWAREWWQETWRCPLCGESGVFHE